MACPLRETIEAMRDMRTLTNRYIERGDAFMANQCSVAAQHHENKARAVLYELWGEG